MSTSPFTATKLIKLAREIATNQREISDIIADYKLTEGEFEMISQSPQFTRLLEAEVTAWNSATNTSERVRLKSAAIVEEWLEEAFARLHDRNESLSAKTELAKLLSRMGNVDKSEIERGSSMGERFVVTINLGQDQQVQIAKDVTPKMIEVSPTEG